MVLQREPNRLSQISKTNGSIEGASWAYGAMRVPSKPLLEANDDDEGVRLIVVWVVRERKSQGVRSRSKVAHQFNSITKK